MATTPLAFPCPDLICHPTKVPGDILHNPGGLIGLPSPGNVIGGALNAIVKMFTGDPKENLKWSMQAVTSTPIADLKAKAFIQLYHELFALIVVLAFLAAVWTMISVVSRARSQDTDASVWIALPSAGLVLAIGAALPGIVMALLWASQSVTQWVQDAFSQVHWKGSLKLPNVGDNISDMFISIDVMMERIVLTMLAEPIVLGVYLFTLVALVSLVSIVTKNGVVGNFTRWALAGLSTGILLQPVTMFVLALGGWIASASNNDRARALVIMFTLLLAIILPLIILILSKKRIDTAVKNREIRIRGDVNSKQLASAAQQKRDAQHAVNAHVNAMRNHPASATPGQKPRHNLLASAVLIGTGAAVEAKAAGVATKLAANGHHVAAAGVREGHRRYFSPEASAARVQRRDASRIRPVPPPPPPQAPPPPPPIAPANAPAPKKRR